MCTFQRKRLVTKKCNQWRHVYCAQNGPSRAGIKRPTGRNRGVEVILVVLLSIHLSSVAFSEDDVFEAICLLKRNKSDACGVLSEHLMYSSAVITNPLAIFFTAILRHGYMPKCFRDCVFLPIPKGNKDTTCIVKIIVPLLLPLA